jgi:hypothetical protein
MRKKRGLPQKATNFSAVGDIKNILRQLWVKTNIKIQEKKKAWLHIPITVQAAIQV